MTTAARSGPATRDKGSSFSGWVRMTADEYDEALAVVESLLPPPGVLTTLNGKTLEVRTPVRAWQDKLYTEVGEELRRTERVATVEIYEPLPDEEASLYELGIPVVATGDRWHVNVCQKVPLNTERDNVQPAYLRDVRRSVLNNCADLLDADAATASWTNDAASDEKVASGRARRAARQAVRGQAGDVLTRPDPEGSKIAMAEGYTVVHGASLPKAVWKQVKQHELLAPAGQVTPSDPFQLAEVRRSTSTRRSGQTRWRSTPISSRRSPGGYSASRSMSGSRTTRGTSSPPPATGGRRACAH